MDSKKEVIHTGIVRSIDNNGIKVSIVVLSGCEGCQIKEACNMSEQTEKEIEIECEPHFYRIGQEIEIKLKESQGFHILFFGYIFPFSLLIGIMAFISSLAYSETSIGLISFGSLIPYYLLLFVFRKKIKKRFSYIINPSTV
jgi:sigma-E factor negative regulatory protein RseC